MEKIQAIPDDKTLLFIKDFRQEKDRFFLKYRSMRNDIPFTETEVYLVDGGKNIAITGTDGTILYRFNKSFVVNLLDNQ